MYTMYEMIDFAKYILAKSSPVVTVEDVLLWMKHKEWLTQLKYYNPPTPIEEYGLEDLFNEK